MNTKRYWIMSIKNISKLSCISTNSPFYETETNAFFLCFIIHFLIKTKSTRYISSSFLTKQLGLYSFFKWKKEVIAVINPLKQEKEISLNNGIDQNHSNK